MLQFISLYNQRKNDTADELQWGDEIEYHLVHVDPETKKVVPDGQRGEVCIKGAMVMKGYNGLPEKTAEAILVADPRLNAVLQSLPLSVEMPTDGVDPRAEAANARRCAAMFRGDPRVAVPDSGTF